MADRLARQFPNTPRGARHLYAVARFDAPPDGLGADRSSFVLTRGYWSEADAQAQAAKLNGSGTAERSQYFVLPVRVAESGSD
jgi:hypothetical protein